MSAPPTATLLHVSGDIDPKTKVVVYGLAMDRESEIVAAAEAGVSGLHLKSESFADLLETVRTAGNGQALCSPEVSAILMKRVYAFAAQPNPEIEYRSADRPGELEISELLDQGLTNQQIATRLVGHTAHRQESRSQRSEETRRRLALRGGHGVPHLQVRQLRFRSRQPARGDQKGLLTKVQ